MPMTDATLATAAVAASDTIRTIGILHFTIGGTRSHLRGEVLFGSARLQAPALKRALLLHAMRRQLFRAGKDPPSRQSEQSRRRRSSSCLPGSAPRIRPSARDHEGAPHPAGQLFHG